MEQCLAVWAERIEGFVRVGTLSLTWSPYWNRKAVSPPHDITCTTVYADLSREMGMGIGRHRNIDEVEPADFSLMARQLGIGWGQARGSIAQMAEAVAPSMMDCAHKLEMEYGVKAVELAERLAEGCRSRIEVALRACV